MPSHLSDRKQNVVCFVTAIALAKEGRPCPEFCFKISVNPSKEEELSVYI